MIQTYKKVCVLLLSSVEKNKLRCSQINVRSSNTGVNPFVKTRRANTRRINTR